MSPSQMESLAKENLARHKGRWGLRVLLIYLGALSMTCMQGSVHAMTPCTAEVMVKVNMRRAPSIEGRFITVAKEGERVLITDEHEGWYKVILERGEYGYIGWMYGKFLRKLPIQKEDNGISFKKAKQETLVAKAAEIQNSGDDVVENPKISTPAPGPFHFQADSTLKVDGQKREISTPISGKIEMGSERLKAFESDPEHAAAFQGPAEQNAIPISKKPEAPTESPEETSQRHFSMERETGKNDPPVVSIGRKQDRLLEALNTAMRPPQESPILVKRIEKKVAPSLTQNEEIPKSFTLQGFIKFLLRLSPLVLSCLALLFSYNALRSVKQLQQ